MSEMSKRKLILLIVAGIVALGTMIVAKSLMAPTQQQPVQEVQASTTQILAATRNMPTGTILRDSDMKWTPWPAEADTSQLYVKSKDDMGRLVGGVLRDAVREDEPILMGHVVQPHEHGFLAVVLEPGKRAMTIALTPSAEVAGFIFPGDHVDVILTHSFSRQDVSSLTERRVSETVLTDVRVLALDQKSDDLTTDPKVAQLATLEVSPKQAEKLALASDIVGIPGAGGGGRGTLSLALRSLAAESVTEGGAVVPPLTPQMIGDERTATWDSDVSSAYPTVNGEDGLMQKVHVMRGKDATDKIFERHK
jgi:pilus assembly protein CpaB